MKITATYLGPEKSKCWMIYKGEQILFPFEQPVEVDKDFAKILKEQLKPGTHERKFKIDIEGAKKLEE
jgi:hypothetical protein